MSPPSSPDSDVSQPNAFDSEPDVLKLSNRTITLYDWDDTFLPSTFLASLGLRVDDDDELPKELVAELQHLESVVIRILDAARANGIVKIITNAEEGWIQLSGARFMPRLIKHLHKTGVKLVSARTQYEPMYADSPSSWKIAAFAAEIEDTFPQSSDLNVLVIGDSLSERDAAHAVSARMPESYVKSVKLVERPNIAQLSRQIQLLSNSFSELSKHRGSFDVNLTC